MQGTPLSGNISTKVERIAALGKEIRGEGLRTLAHHIDLEWMYEAYRRTRKDGAAGVDGQTAKEYAVGLGERLQSLLERAKGGDHYRAPPVRRVHIPKGDGRSTRPIGIPTLEDKILQRAVAMVLEPIYEQEFLDCSYGFRPGRSAHDALLALWKQLMNMGGGWVLEVDIKSFFDTVDHGKLREILHQRVRDGVLLRLIGKWLNAGVMEEGQVQYPEAGTPQGGVISPLLANIYLHEVLDVWFEREVKPRLRGRAFMVRYADDATLAFEREEDARRVMSVLKQRFEKYALTLHPEKTRLVEFRRPKGPPGGGTSGGGTFDMLGFTHFWGTSQKGKWVVRRKTARSRLARALKRIAAWSRANRHKPIEEQHARLSKALKGHDAYYGITGNFDALQKLRRGVARIWWKWLRRRSRQARSLRMSDLLTQWPLPRARIVHSYVT
jgi:RNA-directed DNA polymerase